MQAWLILVILVLNVILIQHYYILFAFYYFLLYLTLLLHWFLSIFRFTYSWLIHLILSLNVLQKIWWIISILFVYWFILLLFLYWFLSIVQLIRWMLLIVIQIDYLQSRLACLLILILLLQIIILFVLFFILISLSRQNELLLVDSIFLFSIFILFIMFIVNLDWVRKQIIFINGMNRCIWNSCNVLRIRLKSRCFYPCILNKTCHCFRVIYYEIVNVIVVYNISYILWSHL